MCEPTTIGYIALGISALAGGYSAVETRNQGKAIEAQSEIDAQIAAEQGEQAKQAGLVEEEKHLRRVRQMIGSQRAAAAASGVDVNFGTPLEIQDETMALGVADAETIRMNALRQAWGFDVQAVNSVNQGRAARATGRNRAVGTVLTTAANTGRGYYGIAG